MRSLFGLSSILLLLSCSSTGNTPPGSRHTESKFTDDDTMFILALGRVSAARAGTPQAKLRAEAMKNAKAGALGRAMELCRSADPRVYLIECKPGEPKIDVSGERQRMEKELNAAKKLVSENCEGEGAATMCEADYEIRIVGLRKKCIEFAQKKACGGN